MKITRIQLTHFKRFEHVDIIIPDDAEFICITGPNGSGKSTLLNAEEFALYGVSGGLSADHIVSSFAEPGEACVVELDFTHSGHKYNIRRTFKKGKSVKHDVVLKCDGEVRATGVSAVEAEVIRTIGLCAKDFGTVVYSKQDDLRAITDIRPGERKEWFSKSFGLNFIKVESDRILKEKIKEVEQTLATFQGELAALSRADPAEIDRARADLADLRMKIETYRSGEAAGITERASLFERLQEAQLKAVRVGKLIDQEIAIRKDIDTLTGRAETLKVQAESMSVNDEDLANLKEILKEIPQARVEIEEYRTKKATLDRIETERKAAIREEESVKGRIEKIDAKLRESLAGENELIGLKVKICTALGFDADHDVDDAVSQHQAYVSEKIANVRARAETLKEARKKIVANLDTLLEKGAEGTCPFCLQRLGDHYADVEKEYRIRLEEVDREYGQNGVDLNDALEKTNKIPELKPTLDRIRDIRIMLGYRENHLNDLATLQRELLDATKKSMALITEAQSIKYTETDHDACKQSLFELETAQNKYNNLTERASQQASARAQIAEINSQIVAKTAELNQVKATIDKDPLDVTVAPRLEHEVQKLDIVLKSLTQDLAAAIEREKTLTQKIADLETTGARIETIKAQITALKEEMEVLTLTRAAISDYLLYLMQVMRSAIETEVSTILTEITNGKYSRLIVDEEYNLLIQEGDKQFPLDRYSGGEQDVIALALRMALSNILPKLHGVHETFPFLIDEALSSLDPERKENTIRALRVQAKLCRQVFNNTHDQEVVGDHNLRVLTNGPVSTVKAVA
nr:SMC family ATPase [uncultured Methanoregula sp.]